MRSSINEEKMKAHPTIAIVHVAQLHAPSSDKATDDKPCDAFTEEAFNAFAFSQFNVAKTIIANPDALVLDEGLTDNMTEHDYTYEGLLFPGGFTQEILEKIKRAFPNGFPEEYTDLTKDQKNWLVSRNAARVLFSLGIIKSIYKTDTREEVTNMMNQLKELKYFNPSFFRKLFPKPDREVPVFKKIIFDRREETALKLAEEAAIKSGKNNPLILLVYGLSHKFGEKIKLIKNSSHFSYEGRVITTPPTEYDQDFSKSEEKILPCGLAIKRTITKHFLNQFNI